MIILITGASHTGKTMLAQRMLEKYKYPYLSIDHLKMGLIRSGNTVLTPEDDGALTDYLWPIVREMIKTAIENRQNLIVEGCYIPFEWRRYLNEKYLQDIRFICLAMTDKYIDTHFDEIRVHGSDIESRMDDSYCTIDWIKANNRRFIEGFGHAGEQIELIDTDYEQIIDNLLVEPELLIELQDTEWSFEYTDHDRSVARAIVFDDEGFFYFVRAERDDDFGRATLIETSGGGVEEGEDLSDAIKRELKEELGAEVEVICKIGVVSDYYNLIHRHNLNNYFLCKVISFGDKNLTQDELEDFHLSTLKLTYEEAVGEYDKRRETKLGRLIANREMPVLLRAKEIISVVRRAEFKIPDSVNMLIGGKPYVFDDIGMSGSKIMIFDDCVLKIVNYRKENEDTVQMMKWLEGKIPGPKVICYEKDSAHQYLLMSKVPGKMSCDEYFLEHPQELLALLAKALKMLWSVDISDCPRNRDIDAELQEAKYRIENNLVDLDNVEPTTFGEGGFKNPQALLEWLEENRPDYEPVLSHGDFCLPNIFIEDGKISGFIDLGDTGIGDKWRDIALCYRSLQHNFDGSFGGKVYPDFNPDMLFDALGIEPNREKLRYYILLDELF